MFFPLVLTPGLDRAATIRWMWASSPGGKVAKTGAEGSFAARKSNWETVVKKA